MAYSNYSPAYSEDPAPKKRIARSAELPTALTMPNGQPASMDDVRSMYLGQKPVASAVTPQAQPTRIATSAEMPQSMMGMVANRVRAQGAPSQPMQARPVQQTPTIAGFGVGGQAQANRNARLQAGGVDPGMAQRNYYNLRDTRDAHNFAATELRKLANKARERGDLAGASSLMREASQIQRQADSINRDVVSNYSMLAGSVGDLDPATQQRNRDRLNAQIPNAQKMITQQFEADADLKRQKMLAADKRIMERTKNGYTSQPQMDYDKLLGDAAFKDASNADAELMRRRAMLARDGASDLPAFQPFAQPELNLSGILRDQENTLADRAAASEMSGFERAAAVSGAEAASLTPMIDVESKRLANKKLQADADALDIENRRKTDRQVVEEKAFDQQNQEDMDALDLKRSDRLVQSYVTSIGPKIAQFGAISDKSVPEAKRLLDSIVSELQGLSTMTPAARQVAAQEILNKIRAAGLPDTMQTYSDNKLVRGAQRLGDRLGYLLGGDNMDQREGEALAGTENYNTMIRILMKYSRKAQTADITKR